MKHSQPMYASVTSRGDWTKPTFGGFLCVQTFLGIMQAVFFTIAEL